MACSERPEWRGGNAADDEAERRADQIGKSQLPDEGCGNRQCQEELDGIDRADDLARVRPLNQQIAGHDRAPSAAARRIEETTKQAQWGNPLCRFQRGRIEDAAHEEIDADA